MSRWAVILLFATLPGCGSEGTVPGIPCSLADECGPTGDAICLDGRCSVFDESSGYGSAVVDLSFGRDMYEVAASVYIRFLHQQTSDGMIITCSDILQDRVNRQAKTLNPLHASPRYLELNWMGGGTFFPNNLVQFVRPAEEVVVVAEAYAQKQGEGALTAIGCTDGETIVRDQNVEMVIPLDVP